MQFSQIIGHTKLKHKMATTIAEGRIAHAQLFVGAEGTGALPLALAYATLVNCENPFKPWLVGTPTMDIVIQESPVIDLQDFFSVVSNQWSVADP